MPNVFAIVDECLELLSDCDFPKEDVATIEKEVNQIRTLLGDDPFNATRCNFFAKGRFEDLRDRVRAASQDPLNYDALSKISDRTGDILMLLEGNFATIP